jgi:hypothetical protein
MELAFDMPAVRKWAHFSGDYNPIHFDLAHARNAGLDALIVHGMLALIPIKQALVTRHAARNREETQWMKFRAAFRMPVAHDSISVLNMRDTDRNTHFRLSENNAGAEYFRGMYGPVDDAILEGMKSTHGEHASVLDTAKLLHFADVYPGISEPWIALDAVVFSDFMRTKLDIVEKLAPARFSKTSRIAMADTRTVVQTSHTVFVNPAALPMADSRGSNWGQMTYAMLPPAVVVNGAQASGSVSLPVYHNEFLVMLVEIGLLAKVSTNLI